MNTCCFYILKHTFILSLLSGCFHHFPKVSYRFRITTPKLNLSQLWIGIYYVFRLEVEGTTLLTWTPFQLPKHFFFLEAYSITILQGQAVFPNRHLSINPSLKPYILLMSIHYNALQNQILVAMFLLLRIARPQLYPLVHMQVERSRSIVLRQTENGST